MDKTEKLSIVIPAFNAESFIGRCLDSILDQDYHNEVEIIVVNDGSTDSTAKILSKYQVEHPNLIKIVTKENGGLSSARNAGMAAADGEWIWFCDADDYICKNGLSYVLDHFVDSDIDICTFWAITLDHIALKTFHESKELKGDCIYEGHTRSKFKESFPGPVWNHLYRKNAISSIVFRDVFGEDAIFNLEVYLKDLRIRDTNLNIYRYTVNDTQMTRNRNKEKMRRIIGGYEQIFVVAKENQKSVCDDLVLSRSIDRWIANIFTPYMSRLLCADLTKKEFSDTIDRLRKKGVFPITVSNKKHKIYNFIGNHPSLYPIESLIYRKIFIPYILPKLSRN